MGISIFEITLNHFLSIDEIKEFEKAGGDLFEIAEHSGRSALHNAAWLGRTDILQFFLELGLNSEQADKNGTTPLMELFSSPNFNIDAVRLLLKFGANLFVKDNFDRDIVHYVFDKYNQYFLTPLGIIEFLGDLIHEPEPISFIHKPKNVLRKSMPMEEIDEALNKIENLHNSLSEEKKVNLIVEGHILYMVGTYTRRVNRLQNPANALKSHKFDELDLIYEFIDTERFIDAFGIIMSYVYSECYGYYLELFHAAKIIFNKHNSYTRTNEKIDFCINELEKNNRNFDRLSDQSKLDFSEMHAFIKLQ